MKGRKRLPILLSDKETWAACGRRREGGTDRHAVVISVFFKGFVDQPKGSFFLLLLGAWSIRRGWGTVPGMAVSSSGKGEKEPSTLFFGREGGRRGKRSRESSWLPKKGGRGRRRGLPSEREEGGGGVCVGVRGKAVGCSAGSGLSVSKFGGERRRSNGNIGCEDGMGSCGGVIEERGRRRSGRWKKGNRNLVLNFCMGSTGKFPAGRERAARGVSGGTLSNSVRFRQQGKVSLLWSRGQDTGGNSSG